MSVGGHVGQVDQGGKERGDDVLQGSLSKAINLRNTNRSGSGKPIYNRGSYFRVMPTPSGRGGR